MKKQLSLLAAILGLSLPAFASAQTVTNHIADFGGTITDINTTIVTALATLFMALAVTAFFYGMAQFVWATRSGDGTKLKDGKQFMLWGVIALFVMVSIWGIVRYAQRTIGIENDVNIVFPTINFGGSASTRTTTRTSSGDLPDTTTGGRAAASGDPSKCTDSTPIGAPCNTGWKCNGPGMCVADDTTTGGRSGGGDCITLGDPCTVGGRAGQCNRDAYGTLACALDLSSGANNNCLASGSTDGESCATGMVCSGSRCVQDTRSTAAPSGGDCRVNSDCASNSCDLTGGDAIGTCR